MAPWNGTKNTKVSCILIAVIWLTCRHAELREAEIKKYEDCMTRNWIWQVQVHVGVEQSPRDGMIDEGTVNDDVLSVDLWSMIARRRSLNRVSCFDVINRSVPVTPRTESVAYSNVVIAARLWLPPPRTSCDYFWRKKCEFDVWAIFFWGGGMGGAV